MEILQIVERVGSYAGFAAVIGLAVLSALYFSQARDLRRLREWAGRAPERTGGPRPAVRQVPRPTTGAGPRPATGAPTGAAQQGGAAAAPATVAAPPAAATAASTPAGAASPAARPAAANGPAPAAPASGGGAPGRPPPAARPKPAPPLRARPAVATAPAAQSDRDGLAPRYIALIVAGLLVVGGGIAFGVVTFTSDPAPAPAPAAARPGPILPASITVAVLNGTTVPGLAAQLGDRVESAGFQLGNVTNASEQQRAESVVLYVPGAAREARAVGRELRIAQTERAENGERTLAGSARVIVVAGADMNDE